MIIAVDFDGTVVDHRFPMVGPDVPGAVESLQALSRGSQLILWTMRSREYLDDAVAWYKARDIPLYGVNGNPDQGNWTSSPKAYAHAYIDDAAVGCPLWKPEGFNRLCVHWPSIVQMLHGYHAGPIGGHT